MIKLVKKIINLLDYGNLFLYYLSYIILEISC